MIFVGTDNTSQLDVGPISKQVLAAVFHLNICVYSKKYIWKFKCNLEAATLVFTSRKEYFQFWKGMCQGTCIWVILDDERSTSHVL